MCLFAVKVFPVFYITKQPWIHYVRFYLIAIENKEKESHHKCYSGAMMTLEALCSFPECQFVLVPGALDVADSALVVYSIFHNPHYLTTHK